MVSHELRDITPSIHAAKIMADVLDVSHSYLIGSTSNKVKDKITLYRLVFLQNAGQKERDTILYILDFLLQTAQPSSTQQKYHDYEPSIYF